MCTCTCTRVHTYDATTRIAWDNAWSRLEKWKELEKQCWKGQRLTNTEEANLTPKCPQLDNTLPSTCTGSQLRALFTSSLKDLSPTRMWRFRSLSSTGPQRDTAIIISLEFLKFGSQILVWSIFFGLKKQRLKWELCKSIFNQPTL